MKEELISFNTAKLAKQKGFNWSIMYNTCYEENGKIITQNKINHKITTHFPAPTQALLQRWLRDIHKIEVTVIAEHFKDGTNWITQALKWDLSLYIKEVENQCFTEDTSYLFGDNGEYATYEEALEKGLEEGLKLII